MTTHELARQLLAKADTAVLDSLAKRLLDKPGGAKAESPCWCGCGGTTKGRFVPGHDAKFHSRAKQVAKGKEEFDADEYLASLPHDEARDEFLLWVGKTNPAAVADATEEVESEVAVAG